MIKLKAVATFVSAAALLLTGCGKGEGAESTEEVFARRCASCHGEGGGGKVIGTTRVPSFKSDAVTGMTDEQLYGWVANGGAQMPAFKSSLTEEQMRALVRHVREIQKGGK